MIKTAAQIMALVPAPPRRGRPPGNRRCEIPGCEDKHRGLGWCVKHLHQYRRWGDPLHVFVPAGPRGCGCPVHRKVGP